MAKVDVQQQTGIDMANARARTSIDVSHVRNFLHRELHLPVGVNICRTIPHISDGVDGWKRRQRIVSILENDPIFDKSRR